MGTTKSLTVDDTSKHSMPKALTHCKTMLAAWRRCWHTQEQELDGTATVV
jgi:hypothetical protein